MPVSKKIIAGVIGDPIDHSLSPALHNHWLARMNIDGQYLAKKITSDEVQGFFAKLRQGQDIDGEKWVGCNVTVPHKLLAYQAMDQTTPAAKKIGAVNTVFSIDGKLLGDNSDYIGLMKNLLSWSAFKQSPRHRAVVLGAGGAARGVVYGLQQLGYGDIIVINRNQKKSKTLMKDFGITTMIWDDWVKASEHADIVINTTSLGLKGEPLPIDIGRLPKKILLHDIIYGKIMTPFLLAGQKNNLAVLDGLGMLIHQAVVGFVGWFAGGQNSVQPPIDDGLRDYLLDNIQ